MCKFTPLGFETRRYIEAKKRNKRVNLPRWGLKRSSQSSFARQCQCVNLPRWGLKQGGRAEVASGSLCKFTPLGFETRSRPYTCACYPRV